MKLYKKVELVIAIFFALWITLFLGKVFKDKIMNDTALKIEQQNIFEITITYPSVDYPQKFYTVDIINKDDSGFYFYDYFGNSKIKVTFPYKIRKLDPEECKEIIEYYYKHEEF